MSTGSLGPCLDHIVVLVPYAHLQTLPAWVADNFTVSPGGRHGDGKTENRLIVFRDGSYIEVIAFIDDNPDFMRGHWWGDKGFGIIDYAFTLREGHERFEEEIRRKLEADSAVPREWLPGPLKGGSRTKADGTGEKIEWQVAFPEAGSRGAAPFWCFDVTPRERRVPSSSPELTEHPCGAVCVLDLGVWMKDGAASAGLEAYLGRILPAHLDERGRPVDGRFQLQSYRNPTGADGEGASTDQSTISVRQGGPQPRWSNPQTGPPTRKMVGDLVLGTLGANPAGAEAIRGDDVAITLRAI